jgi:hypothetical protein
LEGAVIGLDLLVDVFLSVECKSLGLFGYIFERKMLIMIVKGVGTDQANKQKCNHFHYSAKPRVRLNVSVSTLKIKHKDGNGNSSEKNAIMIRQTPQTWLNCLSGAFDPHFSFPVGELR